MHFSTAYDIVRSEHDHLQRYAELVRERRPQPSDASRRPPSTRRLVALARRSAPKRNV